jgi:hypothetical protein
LKHLCTLLKKYFFRTITSYVAILWFACPWSGSDWSSVKPCFFRDFVFSHLSSVYSRRLQVAFNICTRYVFNLRRYDHLSTRRNDLLGVPLFDYYDFRVLSFFFIVSFFSDLMSVFKNDIKSSFYEKNELMSADLLSFLLWIWVGV